ncbi:GUSB (predicted) [Pycnogonum litorale]
MPVPSSYNDITVDKTIRDHLGWVWYDRQFVVPKSWNDSNTRVNIRFGSVHYTAIVFLNGISVVNHTGGHLPFEAELSEHINWSGSNLLTVAVNNTLTPDTVPQGRTVYYNDSDKYPPGYHQLQYKFDFFNYAGIHRPVILFTTPRNFIYDISIRTGIVDNITGEDHF